MSNITNFIFETDDGAALGFRNITIDGEPWFVAADVCAALGIQNPTQAMERLDGDDRAMLNIGCAGTETNCVNESGLYSLILGSRKPEAKRFKKWVTGEVLPSIRKTGAYVGPDAQLGHTPIPTLFLSHAADIMVAADRTFRSAVRVARCAGLSRAHAVRTANRLTVLKTGVDLLAELQAHEHVNAMEAGDQRGNGRPDLGAGPQDQAALQFWAEYEGGGLQGASCLPLMSTQAHALYRRWCRAQGLEPLPLAQLIAVLSRSGRARHIRKRYATATGEVQGPAAFLVPGGHIDAPAHMGETQYLGQCVAAVQAMLQGVAPCN